MTMWKKFVLALTGKIAFVLILLAISLYTLFYAITTGDLMPAIGGIVVLLLAGLFYWGVLSVDLYVSTGDFPTKSSEKIKQIQKDFNSLEKLVFPPEQERNKEDDGITKSCREADKIVLFYKIKFDLMVLKKYLD